jgi:peptide chain release factor 3
MDIQNEIDRRRTFAIISHPDAGKTTLTEKLLLYSGMIRTAGMVGSRKGQKAASSDWMSMEQERGISITASAMQFEYKDCKINILDTPGHQDFSEDTYRTLTAADSVIMVIDCAKGVEAQTRKLFEACRMRGIPVITFVNKMDAYGKGPIELMEEVETVLGIPASARNWPIGSGKEFKGVADRVTNQLNIYTRSEAGGAAKPKVDYYEVGSCNGNDQVSEEEACSVRDDLELLEMAGNEFSRELYLNCEVTPVFFGSAIYNYGVEPLFDALVELAPSPAARQADKNDGSEIEIEPNEDFSAYVFKLQANMNPKHRDCIAFMRVNSGIYEKDMSVLHHRTKKKSSIGRPSSSYGSIARDFGKGLSR